MPRPIVTDPLGLAFAAVASSATLIAVPTLAAGTDIPFGALVLGFVLGFAGLVAALTQIGRGIRSVGRFTRAVEDFQHSLPIVHALAEQFAEDGRLTLKDHLEALDAAQRKSAEALEAATAKLAEVETYSHEWKHALTDEVQKLMLVAGLIRDEAKPE